MGEKEKKEKEMAQKKEQEKEAEEERAPLTAGPITGVSTINSRLPSAQSLPPIMAPTAGDEDEDDDPDAKMPNPAQLTPETQWIAKYPNNIQVLVQVNLGADATAAGVPSAIPLELSVKTKISDMKAMLVTKVQGAGAT